MSANSQTRRNQIWDCILKIKMTSPYLRKPSSIVAKVNEIKSNKAAPAYTVSTILINYSHVS